MNNDKDIFALETIEELKNYNNYVFKKITNFLVHGKGLDYGCGLGGFIKFINNIEGFKFTGFDINQNIIKNLEINNIPIEKSLENVYSRYENVVSINVLEHIVNDEDVLKNFYKILKNNGRVILYIPNSDKLWTELDDAVGHVRRFTKNNITDKLIKNGFEIVHFEYVDYIGSLVIRFSKILKISLSFNKSFIVFYDKFIFKLCKYLDLFFKNSQGKNMLIVADARK